MPADEIVAGDAGNGVVVRLADYGSAVDAKALVYLLNAYASDPAGGGESLSDFAQSNLVSEMAKRPQ